MARWFKPKQQTNEVGEMAQAVYQDQEEPVVLSVCGSCSGPLEEGESNLCFRCFSKKSYFKAPWMMNGVHDW